MQASRVGMAFAALAFICASPLFAQISQAGLKGTVQDPSGAAVVGATITLKDKGTGSQRTATTGASGEYTIPNLTPADYSLTVSMSGQVHKGEERRDV